METGVIIALIVCAITAIGMLANYLNNNKRINDVEHFKASKEYVTDVKNDLLKDVDELKKTKVHIEKCTECQKRNDDKHDDIVRRINETKDEVCRGFKEIKKLINNGKSK
jgi:uncharacterized protein (UPF0305 family)